MRSFRDVSLQRKLTLISLLTSSVALLLACGAFVFFELTTFRDGMVRKLTTQAQIVGDNSKAALLFEDPKTAEDTLRALAAEPHIVSAAIYAKDQAVFATYTRRGEGSFRPPPPRSAGFWFDQESLHLFNPILSDDETIGLVYIRSDLEEWNDRLKRYALVLALVLAGSFVVVYWLSSKLQHVVSDPILHLAETARKVSQEKNYTVRAAPWGRDEVGSLVDGFNEMLTQIQERDAALQEAHAKLETRVQERTRELQQEIAEHKRTGEALRNSEEQLRQSQKMDAIGRLAGGVAHDFNNLLTVISAYADLSLRRISPDDALRRNVEEIRRAAERAAKLTGQLLAFSRRQVLQPKVLDLNQVVQGMEHMLARLLREDIQLQTSLHGGLGRVKADPSQLEQVILNLAVNARDAMPEGGRITVETANVVLDVEYARHNQPVTEGKYVLLAVSDTGCGMDAETRSRIFEPFFTTKEQGKGTGLGLSTVYGIVKQSEGHINVYSEPGRGATFKVYLPTYEGAEDEHGESQDAEPPEGGTETVLLVEDEDSVRSLVCRILEEHGYRVFKAANGQEALDLHRTLTSPIDIMVTDVIMPAMNGRELADRMTSRVPDLKILFMSGYTDKAIVHHGILDAGLAFLQKPFTPDALLRKLRELLGAPDGTAETSARSR